MAIWQGRPKRKPSGGRLRLARKKRRFEVGREKQTYNVNTEKLEREMKVPTSESAIREFLKKKGEPN